MKLNRTVDQWRNCDPELMSEMSNAAIMYAFRDAKHDILALVDENDHLRAEWMKVGRAFEIADEAMEELLHAHGVPLGQPPYRQFALTNVHSQKVPRIEEAEPALVEAFQWLQERGRAELVDAPDGQFIQLKGGAT